jgi:hypothetical protein
MVRRKGVNVKEWVPYEEEKQLGYEKGHRENSGQRS